MKPPVESLNVAVAAAVLVYEAARQREFSISPDPEET
jgi:tRNA G18 (ribose-2'-O)-methylase SpoU